MIKSKFERHVGVELGVVVFVFLVLELVVVALRFLEALRVGASENVVGQHALTETGVAGQGVAQFHVLLAALLDHLRLAPLGVPALDRFVELLVFALGELVDFASGVFDEWLNVALFTSGTTMRVSGTPTMLAAVRWSRSEGGM